MQLNRTESIISRDERLKVNQNWDTIESNINTLTTDVHKNNEAIETTNDIATEALTTAKQIDGKATEALNKSNQAVHASDTAQEKALQAKQISEYVQSQLDEIVADGDSNKEVVQARKNFPSLRARLDEADEELSELQIEKANKIEVDNNLAKKANKTEIDNLHERIDNIVASPTTISEQEIIDARQNELSLGANITNIKNTASQARAAALASGGLAMTNVFTNGNFVQRGSWTASGVHNVDYELNGYIRFKNMNEDIVIKNWYFLHNKTILKNHKYYATLTAKYIDITASNVVPKISFRFFNPSQTVADWGNALKPIEADLKNELTTYSVVFEATEDYDKCLVGAKPQEAYEYQIGNVMLIDLTATFGLGNEPSLEEFEQIIADTSNGYFETYNQKSNKELMIETNILTNEVSSLKTKTEDINNNDALIVVDAANADIFNIALNETNKKLVIKGQNNKKQIILLLNNVQNDSLSLPIFISNSGLQLKKGKSYKVTLSYIGGDWSCDYIEVGGDFYDDFRYENGELFLPWETNGKGAWRIEDKILINKTLDSARSIAHVSANPDAIVSVTLKPQAAANLRLMLRYNEADESYITIGCDNKNALLVSSYKNDTRLDNLYHAPEIILVDGDKLSVRAIGKALYIYVNDHLINTVVTTFNMDMYHHGVFSTGGGGIYDFKVEVIENHVEYGDAIYASGHYLIKYVDDKLFLSNDCGKTFVKSLNISILDNLQYIHMFENGELLIADNKKCYYSEDFLTLKESTVYDIDGSIFVPTGLDNFHSHIPYTNVMKIGELEMRVWGNYTREASTSYIGVRIWYTVDKGKTVKCCYKFGETTHSNLSTPLSCRHVHNVAFNPHDNSFWIQTGDEPREENSHWIKALYDAMTDTWTFEHVGSGDKFKTTTMHFIDDDIFYCWDVGKGGVAKVKYVDAADVSKHEQILSTPNDAIGFHIGKNGDMIVICSTYGGTADARHFYYSPNKGRDWHLIVGETPSDLNFANATYYNNFSPNAEGRILAGIYSLSVMPLNKWRKKPSVYLDDFIRCAGFENAFKN